MGQHFQTDGLKDTITILEAQIRECYGRVAYSHKTHEKCADLYNNRLRWIKMGQIILSAITTGGIIYSLFGDSTFSGIIAATTSTILLILNFYTKNYDLRELEQVHARVATQLWNIRESYLSLLTDIAIGDQQLDSIREKRDIPQEQLKNIYQTAPRTLDKAYIKAQAALKFNDELTFSDEEIDNLLPARLRKIRDSLE